MNAPDIPFAFDAAIAAAADRLTPRVVAWRRDFHQNPELGNREVRTARIVAEHLRALGFDSVQEKVAHTGVVGVLKGGLPGPVVALRADMDALPVAEEVDVPFKSTTRTEWSGQQCGVMHACGHDAHTAILMGVAELLAGMRARIPGTVKFVFQPAEETPPIGEEGGAKMMVQQGALKNPDVGAIFGLHITSVFPTGMIGYRSGPMMASADDFRLIRSYSPYDNVRAQNYPAIFAFAGLTDPRVTYWEPAKWVAKLRAVKTDENPIVFRTNMDAGHGGASGRFDRLNETAFATAFALKVAGKA